MPREIFWKILIDQNKIVNYVWLLIYNNSFVDTIERLDEFDPWIIPWTLKRASFLFFFPQFILIVYNGNKSRVTKKSFINHGIIQRSIHLGILLYRGIIINPVEDNRQLEKKLMKKKRRKKWFPKEIVFIQEKE